MILYFILAVGLVTAIWNLYYRQHWAKNIAVRLRFETDALYAGEATKLYEVIENRKAMPLPVLEVGFHTKRELDFAEEDNANVSDFIYKLDIFAVLGRQKITREIPLKCTRRGYYEVREADLITYSLLHKKRLSKTFQSDAAIYVYAKMTNVSDIMSLCERMLGTLQCAKRLYEDPFAFRTIRDYTVDDPMKTINWKASAKTGALMVNTFDSVLSQKAMLFLDVEDTGILKHEDLVEESIAITATLVRRLLRQGIEVGFCFNGGADAEGRESGFAPTNEKGLLIHMEHMLAEYRLEDGAHSYETEFGGYSVTEDTLLVFITKNLNDTLFEAIKKRAGEKQTIVVYPVHRGEAPQEEASSIRSGKNIRVLVREVDRQ
ncbi:MAG: DUF58 domain-containing protein [Roseburia sp.]|nr:DUF58 domain-containing protein [Roseburia sp.]